MLYYKHMKNLQNQWDILEERRKELTKDIKWYNDFYVKKYTEKIVKLKVILEAIEEAQLQIAEETKKSIP